MRQRLLELLTSTDPDHIRQGAELVQGFSDPALFSALLEGSVLSTRGRIEPGGCLDGASEPTVVLLLAACAPPGTVVHPSLVREAIVCLDLRGSQEMFSAFGRFSNLRWLDLSDKLLTALPAWVAALPRLEGLVARGNLLTAVSPMQDTLKVVDLSSNQLATIPPLPGLEALYLDNNPISSLPEVFPCGRLSLVGVPLPEPLAAPVGVGELVRSGSPGLGEMYVSGDYLGAERTDPVVEELRLSRGAHRLTLQWDSGEQRWFSVEGAAKAQTALLALLSSPDGADWDIAPVGTWRWSGDVARAAVVALAGEALAERSRVPLARKLLAAARADLEAPLPEAERQQLWATTAAAEARMWHALVADAVGSEMRIDRTRAGDPIPHPDVFVALWEQLDEGWGNLALLFCPDPARRLLELAGGIQWLPSAEAPYRIADLSSALVRGWGLPVR